MLGCGVLPFFLDMALFMHDACVAVERQMSMDSIHKALVRPAGFRVKAAGTVDYCAYSASFLSSKLVLLFLFL